MQTFQEILRSPRSLLILEAVVRTGSCTAAAREFNLTQPSVSRNIAQLEATLGTPLFLRKPTGLEPTPEGRLLHRAIADSLVRIEQTVEEICQHYQRRQPVILSLSTAFVTHWFVPRMLSFNQAFPDVGLRFELTSGALRGPPGNVDLAMRRTATCTKDDYNCPFLPEIVLPVCSNSYLQRHGMLTTKGAVDAHILLELTETEIGWRMLLGERAEPIVKSGQWHEFSDYAVVLQTAIGGQGIALGWISAVSRLLADGTLVPAANLRFDSGNQFCLITPPHRPLRPIVHQIRDWMVEEMRREHQQLSSILSSCEALSRPRAPARVKSSMRAALAAPGRAKAPAS